MQEIVSWNVNGIRAIERKGFLDWLAEVSPDIICVQEIKAMPEQLSDALRAPEGYHAVFQPAERKGYSGVATFTRQLPDSVEILGCPEFDVEGRVQVLTFGNLSILNCYFPNSQAEGARIDYKIGFCNALQARCNDLVAQGRHVLVCGDYNIAHRPIDLANPKENEGNPGYLPQERAWIDQFLTTGFVDTFREFCDAPEQYTWWSYRLRARRRNLGWRIDYHCISETLRPALREASILSDVMGSDHCPVRVVLDL